MSKDLLNQYSFRVFLEGAEALELGFSRISGLQVGGGDHHLSGGGRQ